MMLLMKAEMKSPLFSNARYQCMDIACTLASRLKTGNTETVSLAAAYPYLEQEDILQALLCAAWLAEGREFGLTTA